LARETNSIIAEGSAVGIRSKTLSVIESKASSATGTTGLAIRNTVIDNTNCVIQDERSYARNTSVISIIRTTS
jgi:hypothetical protein